MIICFTLSMPNVGSWNGKWTGSSNYYAITKNIGRTKKAIEKGEKILKEIYYIYDFGDGWTAKVSVSKVDAKEAANIRRKSNGFCRYDWMVDSILDIGEIKTETERKKNG